MNIINFPVPETGSFLVTIILWLATVTSSIVVGVILFTLILKLITLPFDYISRASARKNSILMEKMRPDVEKLQKQYADRKDLYNQKMMALYKKNGYSMFGACLPMIISLIIFIVAINGFNDYASYQNKKYFYDMSVSYNGVVYDGINPDGIYIIESETGALTITEEKKLFILKNGMNGEFRPPENPEHVIYYADNRQEDGSGYVRFHTGGYVYLDVYGNKNEYVIREEGLKETNITANGFKYGSAEFDEYFNNRSSDLDKSITDKAVYFIREASREAAAVKYSDIRENQSKFLWIKNIWVTDSATKHPILECKEFNSTYGDKQDGCSCKERSAIITQENYDELTYKLSEAKTEPNGYFILVALTAGISLLTQLVMSKTQKAQMELQTVDGQGAQTQKIMTWMMPIMMAVFSFMYTAAFSIYIILSSVISLGATFAINAIVDVKYKNKNGGAPVTDSRVYELKEENSDKPAKKEKKKKEKTLPENDFLSGNADKKGKKANNKKDKNDKNNKGGSVKHIRGRLK